MLKMIRNRSHTILCLISIVIFAFDLTIEIWI